MTDHLTFEQLCDLHDGELDAVANDAARNHLVTCAACTAELADIAMLAEQTAKLPPEVAPPNDLWSDIKADLAPRHAPRRAGFGGWKVRQLAAAGVLIALGSSALTVALMRRSPLAPSQVSASAPRQGQPSQPSTSVLPASLASEESGFTRSVDVLQRTLDERRDSLAPSTIQTVERSLRVADSAIAEAREALARDPGNRALAKLFASNYERKIDLLRRATELAPRT